MQKIAKDTIRSVRHTLNVTNAEVYATIIDEFWTKVKEENPYLAAILSLSLSNVQDPVVIEHVGHGFFLALYPFFVQEQIDELEEIYADMSNPEEI